MSGPDLEGLRVIRALLIDAAFAEQLDELVDRSHNRPKDRMAMAATLGDIRVALRDQLADRVEQHSQTGLVALSGGVALAVGAAMAVATQILVYPPLVIVPLAIGVFFGWRGSVASKRLALEISALNDIVESVDTHIRFVKQDD